MTSCDMQSETITVTYDVIISLKEGRIAHRVNLLSKIPLAFFVFYVLLLLPKI